MLPGSAKEKPQIAEVVAVGPGGMAAAGKEVEIRSFPLETRLSQANMPERKLN